MVNLHKRNKKDSEKTHVVVLTSVESLDNSEMEKVSLMLRFSLRGMNPAIILSSQRLTLPSPAQTG